ncbi:A disintegrin and metalloproteinase with thrombospondin motifs 20 [Ambystoma mexicanum]|uniref:A disintegrin and metalloproteinase with thrombospondin motifs 20 n=1 Tax=Ambystoma mexicanum TaxID=8296 RepID=UPI0037E8C56A
MQAGKWLAALLCHLYVLLSRSWEAHFHPKQESLVQNLPSYQIVTPVRVNDFGEAFPRTHHYRRRKRSAEELPGPRQAHYHISAYGQLFRVNLNADASFIGSAFSVKHLGGDGGQGEAPPPRHCFYSGHVNEHPAHTAVLSLCGGLMGTFRVHDGEYFLEPLMKADGGDHEEEHDKPHIIYRHEGLKGDSNRPTHKPCEASESHETKDASSPPINSSQLYEDMRVLHTMASLPYSSKNISVGGNVTHPHSRTKRFLSYPRYVEVMVTADSKMVRHHGRNLQHYILTLMSIVAAIYKDPSIGNLINILIVKLVVIHNEEEGPAISYNAATTLHNFCTWQQTQNTADDAHPSHHDTAVLVTREDICRASDKCDTLGLAELGTMCDQYRSCSISEENGLSAAFTIAHELGHVFNMPHDDNPKCKEAGIKHQFHVMAPTLNYNTSPWTWSKCSQKYVTEFLDTGYGECLLDKPSGRTYDLSFQLPGITYDVNKQCELMFGPGSQVCPYLKQCKRLWCTSAEGVHKGCRTQHMPLADGTDCGPGMHCHHGLCVDKDMETRQVDGHWGAWGAYSACSRTCGGGIKTITRDCNGPQPRNGGKYCVGRRMKFRSCNIGSCPTDGRDFREVQCSGYDGKHFNINGLPPSVHWIPKYSGILMKDRCKLFCRVSGTTAYYQLKDRVADGTPCGPETNDLCVQGLCRQAGCDHVLNSKARRDKCGVCGGDNSSCKTQAGTFNEAQYGYTVVVKIPVGATNIDIRQHSYSGKAEDDNYLALSDSKGHFVLNGNFFVSKFKREINVKGATLEYSGSDHIVERINCTDRLEEEMVLQVLCVGNLYNPDVRYSFNIPIQERSDQFLWDTYGPWQDCSKICQGTRKRKNSCIRRGDRLVVSDQRCEQFPQPPTEKEPCNTECELRWLVIGKSECTSQCGPGHRTLDIRCMRYSLPQRQSDPVDNKFCSDQPKPATREACHGDCLATRWQHSEWSPCSKTCGRGLKSREAYCMNNFGHRLADRECHGHQKITTQSCGELSCPEWTSSEWSECLVTCGKGNRHRQVFCQLNDESMSDSLCDPNNKPTSVKSCELQECASWLVGPWGSCSVTCGHGYEMRAVKCVTGTYGAHVDDRECNAASRPRDSQDCEKPPCQEVTKVLSTSTPADRGRKITEWRFGSWTPCSVSCGKGTQARYVSCRDADGGVAHESLCAHAPRPEEASSCFTPCGEWQAGDWSQCSVTCGDGRAFRQVVCMNYRRQMDDHLCDPEGRPTTEQTCSMPPCQPPYHRFPDSHANPAHNPHPDNTQIHKDYTVHDKGKQPSHPSVRGNQWRTGPWGACSSTCNGGFHRRAVVCQDEEGSSASHCDETTKPPESRHCDSGPCPRWNYGSWGECTQTCGGGVKTRIVICQASNGQILTDQNCEILDKPPNMSQCNAHACPGDVLWHRRPWQSCSVSCGKGVKLREVHCISKDFVNLEEENCRHLEKPKTHRTCRLDRCPSWKANRWKECSVTCGGGTQQREVYCRLKGQGQVHQSMCNAMARPDSRKHCWRPECMQYQWLAEEWQECSMACKKGESQRKIKCVDGNRNHVKDNYCDASTRPPSTKRCRHARCRFVVVTEDLSQCSARCSTTSQRKVTRCVDLLPDRNYYAKGLRSVFYKKCPVRPLPRMRKCRHKGCLQAATWKVGKWSKCSVTCGVGKMERRVECKTDRGVSSDMCLPHLMPKTKTLCHAEECERFTSCKDLQIKKRLRKDGEFLLNIKGQSVKVYCAGMPSESPKEYVTLPKGEADNFSEVYGYRLKNPYVCPFNGSRNLECECKNDYLAAGYTMFSKIRLDVISMQIKTTDLLFAHTLYGKAVPFATAGDCYSAAKCPQGRFSINLSGTGLRISNEARWVAQGNYATVKVHRSQDGTKIYGKCGGYCGKCIPLTSVGLQVQIQ